MNIFINFAGFMRQAFLLIFSITILFSCKDSYNYVSRKGTVDQKYIYAKKFFDKKKYSKSQPLLDEIYPMLKGTAVAEDAYYMLAYSHYKLHDYLLASYYFENFTKQYRYSSREEECAFMHCICEFYKSIPYYLDQSITVEAINQFTIFVNNYPNSKYMADCNEHLDKLRAKLHKKAYNNAMLYYRIGDYKAATVALENAIKDYPDLPQKEEFRFLIVKSHYLYAKNSILKYQLDRYNRALEASTEFYAEYSAESVIYDADMKVLIELIKQKITETELEMKKLDVKPAKSPNEITNQ